MSMGAVGPAAGSAHVKARRSRGRNVVSVIARSRLPGLSQAGSGCAERRIESGSLEERGWRPLGQQSRSGLPVGQRALGQPRSGGPPFERLRTPPEASGAELRGWSGSQTRCRRRCRRARKSDQGGVGGAGVAAIRRAPSFTDEPILGIEASTQCEFAEPGDHAECAPTPLGHWMVVGHREGTVALVDRGARFIAFDGRARSDRLGNFIESCRDT
jgi:hypothetical protein